MQCISSLIVGICWSSLHSKQYTSQLRLPVKMRRAPPQTPEQPTAPPVLVGISQGMLKHTVHKLLTCSLPLGPIWAHIRLSSTCLCSAAAYLLYACALQTDMCCCCHCCCSAACFALSQCLAHWLVLLLLPSLAQPDGALLCAQTGPASWAGAAAAAQQPALRSASALHTGLCCFQCWFWQALLQ